MTVTKARLTIKYERNPSKKHKSFLFFFNIVEIFFRIENNRIHNRLKFTDAEWRNLRIIVSNMHQNRIFFATSTAAYFFTFSSCMKQSISHDWTYYKKIFCLSMFKIQLFAAAISSMQIIWKVTQHSWTKINLLVEFAQENFFSETVRTLVAALGQRKKVRQWLYEI